MVIWNNFRTMCLRAFSRNGIFVSKEKYPIYQDFPPMSVRVSADHLYAAQNTWPSAKYWSLNLYICTVTSHFRRMATPGQFSQCLWVLYAQQYPDRQMHVCRQVLMYTEHLCCGLTTENVLEPTNHSLFFLAQRLHLFIPATFSDRRKYALHSPLGSAHFSQKAVHAVGACHMQSKAGRVFETSSKHLLLPVLRGTKKTHLSRAKKLAQAFLLRRRWVAANVSLWVWTCGLTGVPECTMKSLYLW